MQCNLCPSGSIYKPRSVEASIMTTVTSREIVAKLFMILVYIIISELVLVDNTSIMTVSRFLLLCAAILAISECASRT